MTKAIRVENADTSTHRVRVWIERWVDGSWVRDPTAQSLDYPTALTTQTIHDQQRLVIEEVAG